MNTSGLSQLDRYLFVPFEGEVGDVVSERVSLAMGLHSVLDGLNEGTKIFFAVPVFDDLACKKKNNYEEFVLNIHAFKSVNVSDLVGQEISRNFHVFKQGLADCFKAL